MATGNYRRTNGVAFDVTPEDILELKKEVAALRRLLEKKEEVDAVKD